jgi:hypothetical protein
MRFHHDPSATEPCRRSPYRRNGANHSRDRLQLGQRAQPPLQVQAAALAAPAPQTAVPPGRPIGLIIPTFVANREEALIEEAEALKTALRDSGHRAHELLVALKRHSQQTRLVPTSLRALKDLQSVESSGQPWRNDRQRGLHSHPSNK